MPFSSMLRRVIQDDHPKVAISDKDVRPAGPGDVFRFETAFRETEPNNSQHQANFAGDLSPGEVIHIKGHVHGQTDPRDFYDYKPTSTGIADVVMVSGNKIVFSETYPITKAHGLYWYSAWATGHVSADYDTYITLITDAVFA
jgi:hypothetical protein